MCKSPSLYIKARVVTFRVKKLLQFALKKLLHFASDVVTIRVNVTFCGVTLSFQELRVTQG